MKTLAVILVLLAVAICILPLFSDCESQGRALTLEDGRQVAMKCHWTGRAELVVGIPLFAVGVLQFFSRRRETLIGLGVLAALLGVLVILLPTSLIGVCMSADMLCNSLMKPALILLGSLTVAAGIATLVASILRRDAAPA